MHPIDRRTFLGAVPLLPAAAVAADPPGRDLAVAPFRFDVTPPLGHPLLGGWLKPAEVVDDPLHALGFVLLGAGKPVVVCAVDWAGIMNGANVAFRTALAEAAGTTPDRVAVQCVHQHDTPFVCLETEEIVAAHPELPHVVDVDFFRRTLDRGRAAVAAAVKRARPLTHVAAGKAKVEQVAANRRVYRDAAGKVLAMRGSKCTDPKLRDLPEGLIDPWLRTVAFYDKGEKVAALHHYACHPMSHYGNGRVSADFVGLARAERQAAEPGCLHVYFTGCAGNVAAGKYNDGAKETRPALAKRVAAAMAAAGNVLKPEPVASASWKATAFAPTAREDITTETLTAMVANGKNSVVNRNRPAYQLAWIQRAMKKAPPVPVSALHVNAVSLLHLPAEAFVEYQLRAQAAAPDRFVAVAAYGDGGPWYLPTKEEFPAGGYEVSMAYPGPEIDDALTAAMRAVLA